MRAVVCPRYGGPEVLELREVERPRPKDDEVCIQVKATAVTASDIFIRGSDIPLRFRIPMRLMIGITRPRKSDHRPRAGRERSSRRAGTSNASRPATRCTASRASASAPTPSTSA